MAVNWTPEVWQLAYRAAIENPARPDHGEFVTYGRRFWPAVGSGDPVKGRSTFQQSVIERYEARRSNLQGVITNTSGLVVGCAFGYLIEAMLAENFTNVWGCETSQWIFDNLVTEQPDATVRDRIKQIDIRAPNIRTFFRDFIGGNGRFGWVLTEEVLSSYTDAELPAVLDACEFALSGTQVSRIVHIVDTSPPPFNQKTPEAWKAVRPTHTWVAAATGQVI